MRPLLFLAFLAACTSTAHSVRLETGPARPPLPADSVRIYRSAAQVPGPYVEVGIITAQGYTITVDDARLIERMREEAGKLGANALILDASSDGAAQQGKVNVQVNEPQMAKGRSVAIYVKPSGTE